MYKLEEIKQIDLTQGDRSKLHKAMIKGAEKVQQSYKIVEECNNSIKQEQEEATETIQELLEEIRGIKEDTETQTDLQALKEAKQAIKDLQESVDILTEQHSKIKAKYTPELFQAVVDLNTSMKEYKELYKALYAELQQTMCVRELEDIKQFLVDADIVNYMYTALSILERQYPESIVNKGYRYKHLDGPVLSLKVTDIRVQPDYFIENMDKAQAEANGEYVSATMFGMQM